MKMPNWCQNNLVVTGDPQMLDTIQKIAFDFNKILPVPAKLNDEQAYEWRCNNWWTKWDAGEVEMKREDTTTLLAYFATAWGSPIPILKELAKKYNTVIMLEWEIELGNGKGIMRIDKNGTKEISKGESENYMNLGTPENKYDWSKNGTS